MNRFGDRHFNPMPAGQLHDGPGGRDALSDTRHGGEDLGKLAAFSDLLTDRAGDSEAFIAFKGLDAKRPDGKRNPKSIVIADDKMMTMADVKRKRQERSDKARAAAARRKQQ